MMWGTGEREQQYEGGAQPRGDWREDEAAQQCDSEDGPSPALQREVSCSNMRPGKADEPAERCPEDPP
jgi:hypothetical protein